MRAAFLPAFRRENPNVRFNINGLGDVPLRLGAPDLRVTCNATSAGEVLFTDLFAALSGPDNTRRMADLPADQKLEGMPLLHFRAQREGLCPGWVEWSARFGHRDRGADRGVTYPNPQLAVTALRENIGFLVCGLSLCLSDIAEGRIVFAFPPALHLPAPHPYRMALRAGLDRRPQTRRFLDWLREEAAQTRADLAALAEG